MKFGSKLSHGFTNQCFYTVLRGKKSHKPKYFGQFIFQNVQNVIFEILKMFKKEMKLTITTC